MRSYPNARDLPLAHVADYYYAVARQAFYSGLYVKAGAARRAANHVYALTYVPPGEIKTYG